MVGITKSLNVLLVLLVAIFQINYNNNVQAVTLNQNGYTLNIAMSSQVSRIPDDQRANFLQAVRDTMTSASQLLFTATDNRFFFRNVNILLPRSGWADVPNITITNDPTPSLTYASADIRIEETEDGNGDGDLINNWVQTKNTKPCGIPGEYILVLPQFFTDTSNRYGDKAKVMVHEFAHYRYGVFEEYGYADEREEDGDLFPYAYTSAFGYQKVTSCNSTEIEGEISKPNGDNCTIPADSDCRFRPDLNAATGPTSSLMSMHFLPSVSSFCDSTNHDRTAPNKQNYFCRNRSVKTVISTTVDYKSTPTALPPSTNTVPTFRYYLPLPQAVYIVLDTSNHNPSTVVAFNDIKTQIKNFISTLGTTSSRTYVGVAGMSGETVNLANNRLGGYLNEIQPSIIIQGNAQAINSRIDNFLTRSTAGLLLEPAVLDIGDNLSPFTHQSGSIVLLVKLSDSTATSMNVESGAINLLNSRNIRLVTVEVGDGPRLLERTTSLTNGAYFPAAPAGYSAAISGAIAQINTYLSSGTNYMSRRVQLISSSFTATAATPATGYAWIDFSQSGVELNFFVPTAATGVTFQVRNPANVAFTPTPTFTSWNGQFTVYTVTAATSSAGNWRWTISTTSVNPLVGSVDVAEIIPENTNINIGGGGPTNLKPVEVEVYTSGVNGQLTMSESPEDYSFYVYASVKKGVAVANPGSNARVEATVRQASTGNSATIPMKDDGIYPDVMARDGTFTGVYKPPLVAASNGIYNISVRLDRTTAPTPISLLLSALNLKPQDSLRYAIPIDQENNNSPESNSATYQRIIPYAAGVRLVDAQFPSDRPTRIMDFEIASVSPDGNIATFTWTAPASTLGSQTQVNSYRLVKSTSPDNIIDENGLVSSGATIVDAADIIGGSLSPSAPGSPQSVTVNLRRTPGPQSPPLYFTIGSVFGGQRSFASPMEFEPVADVTPLDTSPVPSTSTATTTSTQTTRTTPSTQPSISARTTLPPGSSSPINPSTTPSTTTTPNPSPVTSPSTVRSTTTAGSATITTSLTILLIPLFFSFIRFL